MILAAVAGSFQQPAYQAATSLLVPKEHLSRAAGMAQLGEPLTTIVAPIFAGLLIGSIGLPGIVGLDFLTFLVAVAALSIVRFPAVPRVEEHLALKPSMRRELSEGWKFIGQRKGLVGLLAFFCILNFVFGFSNTLFVPYILSMADEATLGVVVSIAGAGALAGSLLASTWSGPRKKTVAIFGFGVVIGLSMLAVGLSRSPWAVGASLFVGMFFLPPVTAASQALWQRKTDPAVQGRVFALRRMVVLAAIPVSYLTAGPMADYVFAPGMSAGGSMAAILEPIFGSGPGRGYGVMFAITGVLAAAASLLALATPRLRNLEDDLPDALPTVPPTERGELVSVL